MEVFYVFIFCSLCVKVYKTKQALLNGTFCNLILFGVVHLHLTVCHTVVMLTPLKYPSCSSSTKECFILREPVKTTSKHCRMLCNTKWYFDNLKLWENLNGSFSRPRRRNWLQSWMMMASHSFLCHLEELQGCLFFHFPLIQMKMFPFLHREKNYLFSLLGNNSPK